MKDLINSYSRSSNLNGVMTKYPVPLFPVIRELLLVPSPPERKLLGPMYISLSCKNVPLT